MSDVQLDYEKIKASARRLEREREDITTKLTELDRMVDGLVQDAFRTRLASPKLRESFSQWHTGAKNAIEGLEGISAFLDKAVQGHQDLDQNLSSGLGH